MRHRAHVLIELHLMGAPIATPNIQWCKRCGSMCVTLPGNVWWMAPDDDASAWSATRPECVT